MEMWDVDKAHDTIVEEKKTTSFLSSVCRICIWY